MFFPFLKSLGLWVVVLIEVDFFLGLLIRFSFPLALHREIEGDAD